MRHTDKVTSFYTEETKNRLEPYMDTFEDGTKAFNAEKMMGDVVIMAKGCGIEKDAFMEFAEHMFDSMYVNVVNHTLN